MREFLTTRQVAERIGSTLNATLSFLKLSRVRSVRLGRAFLWNRCDVEKVLAHGTAPGRHHESEAKQ